MLHDAPSRTCPSTEFGRNDIAELAITSLSHQSLPRRSQASSSSFLTMSWPSRFAHASCCRPLVPSSARHDSHARHELLPPSLAANSAPCSCLGRAHKLGCDPTRSCSPQSSSGRMARHASRHRPASSCSVKCSKGKAIIKHQF
jgi:hypothetical protein